MKAPHFPGVGVAVALLLTFAASAADAQRGVVIGGWGSPPRHHGGGHHGGGPHGKRGFQIPYVIVEREPAVIIEREIVREVPVIVEAPPPPPPRKPYVIGASYASLPGGCMKLIEAGASYYYCSGEWYRQAGNQYRAVAKP